VLANFDVPVPFKAAEPNQSLFTSN